MPYDSIPGVSATFLDGAFRNTATSGQPKILILGAASSGLSYELYQVTSVGAAETEFGATAEFMKPLHEALAQGADNISVMRIGGKRGAITITDSDGGTLTVTPYYRDDTILDRYALIVEALDSDGDTTYDSNRIMVYDLEKRVFVYDSEDLLVLDTGVVEVDENSFNITTLGDKDNPDDAIPLSELTGSDLVDFTGAYVTYTVTQTATPADGMSMSLVERYAALNEAYRLLDYRDADVVIPAKAYLDDKNVVDDDTPDFSSVPTAGSAADTLGYLWQYRYRGKTYTYFVEDMTVISTDKAVKTVGQTTSGRLAFTAVAAGPAGEGVTVNFVDDVSSGAESVSVSGSAITIHFESGVSTAEAIKVVYDAVAAAIALATVASTSGALTLAASALSTAQRLDLPGVLKHDDLTGDSLPSAVETKWRASIAAEFRECNFAHQLASFCYTASTNWKALVGVISVRPLTTRQDEDGAYYTYSVSDIANWVGELPTFSTYNGATIVDGTADNGFGLLGNKFVAGASGYRDWLVTDGTADQGYAYGGLILTEGLSLPNEEPYGINDNDEALDTNSQPVDIGKHIFITYDYPIHRNSYSGGTTYRGDLVGAFAGKIATTDAKSEPIGVVNGLMRRIAKPPKILSPQINDLAKVRMIGTRFEEGVGLIIVSAHTAAHPDSDYTKYSTIASVNRELTGIRNIAKPYIGREFSPTQLISLQASIDSFLKNERNLGYNQGAIASIVYSRTDRIMGKLTIRLKMIPPFAIEAITVETSLAAEESELG